MAKTPDEVINNLTQPKPRKTVGEELSEYYNNAFFDEAKGDRDEFISHNITRFGVPRGSTRKKEMEVYGSIFDKLAKERGVTPISPEQRAAKLEERSAALLEKYNRGEIDLEQLHNQLLNVHGDIMPAFEWLVKKWNRK